MNFLPELLNRTGAFRCLAPFLQGEGTDAQLAGRIEQFLYRACCALAALGRMRVAEEAAVRFARTYKKQLVLPDGGRIALSAEPLFEVYSQVPAALSQIVNMQNLVLPILQRALPLKGSVPSSLRSALKKGVAAFGLSSDQDSALQEYWTSGGRWIRDVRDVNEHLSALVEHTFVCLDSEPGQVRVLLPDNPEEKSPGTFTYERDLDAFETISSGLNSLDETMGRLLAPLRREEATFGQSLNLSQVGVLLPEQERTLGLMIEVIGATRDGDSTRIEARATEIRQVIPKDGRGNVQMRLLRPDLEIPGGSA